MNRLDTEYHLVVYQQIICHVCEVSLSQVAPSCHAAVMTFCLPVAEEATYRVYDFMPYLHLKRRKNRAV